MRTPDEIKLALKCCTVDECNSGCPYIQIPECVPELVSDALTYISKLEADCDAWQRRAEAAERDLRSIIEQVDDGCKLCAHYHICPGKSCPHYRAYVGVTADDGTEYPNIRYDCRELEYGKCPALIDTPCDGCDYYFSRWRWRGPCAENGGAENGDKTNPV